MLFKKLFQVLVVGGAVVSAASGCVPAANAGEKGDKKAAVDGGTPNKAESGGGVKGW